MLHTKSQGNQSSGSGEDFKGRVCYLGVTVILVILRSGPRELTTEKQLVRDCLQIALSLFFQNKMFWKGWNFLQVVIMIHYNTIDTIAFRTRQLCLWLPWWSPFALSLHFQHLIFPARFCLRSTAISTVCFGAALCLSMPHGANIFCGE